MLWMLLIITLFYHMSNNILIVGASKGLGKAVCKELIDRKAVDNLYVVARSESSLKEIDNYAIAKGVNCEYVLLDLNKPKEVESSLKEFSKEKNINVFFYNAGYLKAKNLVEIEEEEVSRMYNVNLFSFISSWKGIHRNMDLSNNPQVITSGSMGGFQGSVKFPSMSTYSSSKAALANLMEVLAEEHKEEGIIFNTLSFGAINTEMLQEAFPDYKCDVNPEDMANFVCNFILGPRLFNGKNIPVSITTP